ncbi:hypothetical protein [Paraurantiacibacter namhicola]|uniref:Uncharacterized protein n=1 Tax=Paraurantiacibacter namhicola TaxID=645517 RepID=A0A1C7DA05_9SPHN|nr:hypothetical protein [Paraurantiacibacter namhicola]ANU08202.1 hypothetical protein A6F65_01909 [Paraurantiacibacter namhicola]
MIVTIGTAMALAAAGTFGDPGFPTQEEVLACQEPVSMVMATTIIEVEQNKDNPDPDMVAMSDRAGLANAKLLAWEQYYAGYLFDHPEFEERAKARNKVLATASFEWLRATDKTEAEMAGIKGTVAKAFECIAMTEAHDFVARSAG